MKYKLTQLGIFCGPCVFVWPWRRAKERVRVQAARKRAQRDADREASRLRALGASDAGIWRQCYWVGHPHNTKWRRLRCWIVGDFMLLEILREHTNQQASPYFPKVAVK